MNGSWLPLLRAEVDRLRWRRAVLLLVLGAVVVTAFTFTVTAWDTRPVSDEEVAEVRQTTYVVSEIDQCTAHPRRYLGPRARGLDADEAARTCEELVLGWYSGRPTLDVASELGNGFIACTVFVVLLLLLMGATFAGHDWSTGSMSNQLLYETRRTRVWLAKALVVGVAGLVVSAVLLGALWGGLLLLASSRDLPVPDAVVADGWAQVARTAVAAALATLLGFALAMLFRSTVATIAVLFALAVSTGGLVAAAGLFSESSRWDPVTNIAALVEGSASYYVDEGLDRECYTSYGEVRGRLPGCDPERTVGAVQGGLYTGLGVVVVGAASVLVHRRRDV
ncbi:ABC transporter permease subunit [Nocardioides bruguierae]|uniref:ABC transporter permease n=1 Tax=Nocardioides bruguierae TaxID=2945102 RepID=A0A9X2D5S6_9ACTN|nr:ABC transporter permease subunit [Nocardioides bruguierae]MCM0619534.1 hypothetical protein [Nocardioides bruguierae]